MRAPQRKIKDQKKYLKTQKAESGTKERGIREIRDGNFSLSILPIFPNFLQINPLPPISLLTSNNICNPGVNQDLKTILP